MSTTRRAKRHYFTVEQANAMLPLVERIVRDIAVLAHTLNEQHRRHQERQPAHAADLDDTLAELERGQEQMRAYELELKELHIELKDYLTGLIDFPARMDGRDVYLCWRMGEPEVSHWHELDSGFAGRQKLAKTSNRSNSREG